MRPEADNDSPVVRGPDVMANVVVGAVRMMGSAWSNGLTISCVLNGESRVPPARGEVVTKICACELNPSWFRLFLPQHRIAVAVLNAHEKPFPVESALKSPAGFPLTAPLSLLPQQASVCWRSRAQATAPPAETSVTCAAVAELTTELVSVPQHATWWLVFTAHAKVAPTETCV